MISFIITALGSAPRVRLQDVCTTSSIFRKDFVSRHHHSKKHTTGKQGVLGGCARQLPEEGMGFSYR